MTINNRSKVAMKTVKSLPDVVASEEARRATADATTSAGPTQPPDTDSEVVPRARRRIFTKADKRRILQQADDCTRPGEIGALMRREGVYSSSLSTWRRQREAGDLAALAPQKRGPKADPRRADALQIAQLTRENDKLKVQLDNANLVIDVQKKLVRCWPCSNKTTSPGAPDGGRTRACPGAWRRRGLPGAASVARRVRAAASAGTPHGFRGADGTPRCPPQSTLGSGYAGASETAGHAQ